MRFGQLIEYNWKTFLEIYTQNVMEKLVLDSLLKNQNWADLWINIIKF